MSRSADCDLCLLCLDLLAFDGVSVMPKPLSEACHSNKLLLPKASFDHL